jgi:hypothetical protein
LGRTEQAIADLQKALDKTLDPGLSAHAQAELDELQAE